MNPGTARTSLDLQIAAKLPHARSDATDANPWPERLVSPIFRLAFRAASIVSDRQVQSTGDPSQVDGDM
jgi:hypothetical protein